MILPCSLRLAINPSQASAFLFINRIINSSPGGNRAASADSGRDYLQGIEGRLRGGGTPRARNEYGDKTHVLAQRGRGAGILSVDAPDQPHGPANIQGPHAHAESKGKISEAPACSAGKGTIGTRDAAHGGSVLQAVHVAVVLEPAQAR